MIIKARHHWFYYPFFKGYSRLMTRLDFRKVNYYAEWRQADEGDASADRGITQLPVFMIGNHFSWWDGFIALNINQRFFRKKFHIMMLEEQLRDRMFLNKAGAFSLEKRQRSMVETFSYTRELLSDPGNLVVMYPQGRIYSMHDQPFVFEKGWYRIIERMEQPVQMVFYFALVDYYSHRKPTLNIYVYAHDRPYGGPDQVETAFNDRFSDALAIQRSYLDEAGQAGGGTGKL
jgi:1-acyl-sn-glycerol-3-phosphate acyltransferase